MSESHESLLEQPEVPHYACPGCGEAVAVGPNQALVQCGHCGEQFFVTAGEEHVEPTVLDDGSSESFDHSGQNGAELSELRIRQVAALRRGAIRTQSWWIIGAGAFLVGAAQLIWMVCVGWRSGLRLGPIGETLATLAALMLFAHCLRRIIALGREIGCSSIPQPQAPPDFSPLSDGSQRFSGLDELL